MHEPVAVPKGLDIEARHWAIVKAILTKHVPDREVWAFGSRVKGTAKPHSDLDLVVLGEQALSLSQQAALVDAFAESDLPWRVDVVDWATATEAFRRLMAERHCVLKLSALA